MVKKLKCKLPSANAIGTIGGFGLGVGVGLASGTSFGVARSIGLLTGTAGNLAGTGISRYRLKHRKTKKK